MEKKGILGRTSVKLSRFFKSIIFGEGWSKDLELEHYFSFSRIHSNLVVQLYPESSSSLSKQELLLNPF